MTGIFAGIASSVGVAVFLAVAGSFVVHNQQAKSVGELGILLWPITIFYGFVFGALIIFPFLSVRAKLNLSLVWDFAALILLGIVATYFVYSLTITDFGGGDKPWVLIDFIRMYPLTVPGGLLGVVVFRKLLPMKSVKADEGIHD